MASIAMLVYQKVIQLANLEPLSFVFDPGPFCQRQLWMMSLQCLGRPRSIIGHDSMYSTHKNIGPMNGRFLDSIIRVVIINYPYLIISYSFQVSNIVQLSYLFRDCYQYLEPNDAPNLGIYKEVYHIIFWLIFCMIWLGWYPRIW
jgi:hypothetical protein